MPSIAHPTRRPRALRTVVRTAVAAGAATLAMAAPAAAASYPVGGGATTLKLDARTGAALTSLGVHVHRVGPATAVPGGFRFPVTGGRIDGDTAAGHINHAGGIQLRAGSTRVSLTNFRIVTSNGAPRIIGRVNGSRAYAPLFNLDLSAARIARPGLSTSIGRVGVTLHPRGAAALRTAFKSHAFTAGLRMGTAAVVAKPRDAVFTGGQTRLQVAEGALAALTSLGVSPGAASNSTLTGATYAFPISGGAVRLGNLAGSVRHTGGITLTKGATVVTLANFTIDTVRGELWGSVNGSAPVALLKLDLRAPKVSTGARTVNVGNVGASLTAGAAAALNGAFATSAFTEDLMLGTATVAGRTA